jgi:hypothetical protein
MTTRPFTKISFRIYDEDRALHEAVRKALSSEHLEATDTDAAKFIYQRGLAAAAKELGIKVPAKKGGAK